MRKVEITERGFVKFNGVVHSRIPESWTVEQANKAIERVKAIPVTATGPVLPFETEEGVVVLFPMGLKPVSMTWGTFFNRIKSWADSLPNREDELD